MSKLRKKIVAGNWKMNKLTSDGATLAEGVVKELAEYRDVDVVLCPPFTALKAVGDIISQTTVKLGAQNMYWKPDGAFTGEISAAMLRDLYCRYVILGHSERRGGFYETDDLINKKTKAALAATLIPIVCVGETLEQREAGQMEQVLTEQVTGSLAGLGDDLAKVVVAYEPVWAIGTGKTATPAMAQEAHVFIRKVLAGMAGDQMAATIRIQYGGSVKPENAAQIFSEPDVDGGLIGGAALEAKSFIEIVRAAVVGADGKEH